MAVDANFSENKLSQQFSADSRYLIHAHFEIEKKQLLVGIFSIWKQFWIELEKTLPVIYNTCMCDDFEKLASPSYLYVCRLKIEKWEDPISQTFNIL